MKMSAISLDERDHTHQRNAPWLERPEASCRPTLQLLREQCLTPRSWHARIAVRRRRRDGFHAGCPGWFGRQIPRRRQLASTADWALRIIAWQRDDGAGGMPDNDHPPGEDMPISVGIEIAQEMHWAAAIEADGVVRLHRNLE